jgi:hypothetical protein
VQLSRWLAAAAAPALLAGCWAAHPCDENLPPPSDPCIPHCGNSIGVGQPCTKGGGECGSFDPDRAWACTVDFSDTTLAFCTRPCVDASDCGEDSVCQGDPADPGSDKGCVPVACAGP